MNPKIGSAIAAAIGIVILIGFFSNNSGDSPDYKDEIVFQVTLADPEIYENGIYKDFFEIKRGDYIIDFVPNGDSPQELTIILNGKIYPCYDSKCSQEIGSFVEEFALEGTLHETAFSSYYTWNYKGLKFFLIHENQELEIIIDPHENLLGSVSVQIKKIPPITEP